MSSLEPYIPLGLVALMILVFIGVPVLVLRHGRVSEPRGVDRIYKRVERQLRRRVPAAPEADPLVEIEFHTYSGFLLYLTQRRHHHILPASEAEVLLWHLHCYNLARSLGIMPGVIFIPFVSFTNYQIQLRRIRRARRTPTCPADPASC